MTVELIIALSICASIVGFIVCLPTIRRIIRIHFTPIAKIGALPAYGMVKVVGRADQKPNLSPISQLPCVMWQLEVKEKNPGSKSGTYWSTIFKKSADKEFEIFDETGRIQICPEGAEVVLSDYMGKEIELNDADLETRTAVKNLGIATSGIFGFPKKLRVYERTISPNDSICILGRVQTDHGQKFIGQNDRPLISNISETELILSMLWRVAKWTLLPLLIGGCLILIPNVKISTSPYHGGGK